jgi:uncharacterized protein YndB with AHSA1/START domain
MPKTETLTVAAKGELEIVMTRVFDAPRSLVFEAWTKPELIQRWLLGPDGWSMPICEVNLVPGGSYRMVWRKDAGGKEMTSRGTYREVVRPERIVCTETFQDPWYVGESVVTTEFADREGRTEVTMTMKYGSKEARDGVLKSGMESGVAVSYDRLEALLASKSAR